ncbi:MAG: low specificity L-threonine aldolase, partial [Ruminococcus sp.]|nr:low specificity L-threonine aldolase [Ruminococcus sp.]
MLSFESDYIQGAHINILNRLIETNMEPLSGYGYDEYTLSAKEKIKKACGSDDVDVFLLTGGTQTNQIVIDTMLNSYEGVICADTGHINCHEAGAIEYSRHKVISLPQNLGKISCDTINDYMTRFLSDENNEHTTQP